MRVDRLRQRVVFGRSTTLKCDRVPISRCSSPFLPVEDIEQWFAEVIEELQMSKDIEVADKPFFDYAAQLQAIDCTIVLPKLLTLSQQSIEICREIGDSKGEAASLNQLSIIYNNLGNLNQALSLSLQSIEIYRQIDNLESQAGSLHQMALITAQQGDLNRSRELFLQTAEVLGSIEVSLSS
jgi:tetratricopeptide (TPR) repeat protein